MGTDGNDGIFPIAYAVTEGETKDCWMWFLLLLIGDIGSVRDNDWTFISDQQKGLLLAVETVTPEAHHRFCLRHLYDNFKTEFKGKKLMDLLMAAAKATVYPMYEKFMDVIKQENEDAYNWLLKVDTKYWYRHTFNSRPKSGQQMNNLSECFNSYILDARDKPILTLLEEIRRKLTVMIHDRRTWMSNYRGHICPKQQVKLEKAKIVSRLWYPLTNGGVCYEMTRDDKQFTMDLAKQTCSCFRWELTGVPCAYAIGAIMDKADKRPEDYVHPYLHVDTYMIAYTPLLNPVNGSDMWPRSGLVPPLPPPLKRQSGRPKKQRRRDPYEPQNPFKLKKQTATLRCGRCNKEGHNKRTCRGEMAVNRAKSTNDQ